MDGLSAEQQALFASIMGNSSQAQAMTPNVAPAAPAPAPVAAAPAAGGDPGRKLSQAEIDALIASMVG
ncbi:MAG: hypothetical protein IJ827_02395 [Lachnospiraceae bacterium]|nr:hypothetical protein [Lachnospiraceae bacterium]MBR1913659.1 hypothetical protein [Lachnospiraceae bacterium]